MTFFVGLLPATLFAVLGYIVLYCAIKSDGAFRAVGRFLAIWLFIAAAFPLLGGAYVTLSDFPLLEMMGERHDAIHGGRE